MMENPRGPQPAIRIPDNIVEYVREYYIVVPAGREQKNKLGRLRKEKIGRRISKKGKKNIPRLPSKTLTDIEETVEKKVLPYNPRCEWAHAKKGLPRGEVPKPESLGQQKRTTIPQPVGPTPHPMIQDRMPELGDKLDIDYQRVKNQMRNIKR